MNTVNIINQAIAKLEQLKASDKEPVIIAYTSNADSDKMSTFGTGELEDVVTLLFNGAHQNFDEAILEVLYLDYESRKL